MNILTILIISLLQCILAQTCRDNKWWKDKHGYNCQFYAVRRICRNRDFNPIAQYYGGVTYNFPELNCCACGKSDGKFYLPPTTFQNKCTHKAANSRSKHVVDYCALAKSQYECNQKAPKWRYLHCTWNARITSETLAARQWRKHHGLYLRIKHKLLLHRTSVPGCAARCRQYSWCKSFDYNHKYRDRNYRKCWLYNRRIDSKTPPPVQTNDRARLVANHYDLVDNTCQDTPNWKDNKGYSCAYYKSKGICKDSSIHPKV